MNILKIFSYVHKLAGTLLKGKATVIGGVLTTIGLGSAAIQGQDVFESIQKLVELAKEGWPHVLVVFGGLTTLAGYFRKAGADAKAAGHI